MFLTRTFCIQGTRFCFSLRWPSKQIYSTYLEPHACVCDMEQCVRMNASASVCDVCVCWCCSAKFNCKATAAEFHEHISGKRGRLANASTDPKRAVGVWVCFVRRPIVRGCAPTVATNDSALFAHAFITVGGANGDDAYALLL